MYKQDSVHQLMESYKITLTNRKMQKRLRSNPLGFGAPNDSFEYYIQEEIVPTVVVELEEKSLQQIADKIVEIDDLMRDPETARLLMEARFINRLKGGR